MGALTLTNPYLKLLRKYQYYNLKQRIKFVETKREVNMRQFDNILDNKNYFI